VSLKRPKTPLTFSFLSHPFCCATPAIILLFPPTHPYHFPSFYFTFLFLLLYLSISFLFCDFSSAVNMNKKSPFFSQREQNFLLVSPYFIYLEIYWYTTFYSFFFIFLFGLNFFVYHYFDLKNYIF
jgi:hypothetical protein